MNISARHHPEGVDRQRRAKKPAGTGTTPGVGAPASGADKTPPANNNSSGSAAA